jgi:glutamine synthetase
MAAQDVLNMMKDNEVKWVDFRFTDTRGKEQHVTVPAHEINEDLFAEGKMFDGSSIAGWKGINESDMILMPDADTAVMDLFTDESTMNLRCDILEPATMEGYNRDPRSVAKRGEEYLKSTGIADTAFFGPEPEFFIFDDVRWSADMSGSMVKIDSEEAAWNTDRVYADGNTGHRPGVKGGYFPVPPVDSSHDLRAAMCGAMEEMGVPVEVHHHEVATANQCEILTRFSTLVDSADWVQIQKY